MYVDLYMRCCYKLSTIIVLLVLLFAYDGYRVFFPMVKWLGHGVNHPSLYSTKVKERAQLYLYPPPQGPHCLFCSELDLIPVWLVQDTVI